MVKVEEAAFICQQIRSHVMQGEDYARFAVLYRTNAQSRVVEEAFVQSGVRYRMYGGLRFYDRKEIKDVLCYLRMIYSGDDISFLRTVNEPRRGIGRTRIAVLKEYASMRNCSLYTALMDNLDTELFRRSRAKEYVRMVEKYRAIYAGMDLTDLLAGILHESGYEDMLRTNGEEERLDNLAELKQAIYDFSRKAGEEVSLGNYLDHAALFTNMDQAERSQAVKLMTVHAAKGLEFPVVFVVGLEEELFPSAMCIDSMRAIEEERRLFYVAITRAERHCFLSYAKSRMRYGKMEFAAPSRFLKDIDVRYLRLPGQMAYTQREEPRASIFTKIQSEAKPTFTPSAPRNLKPVAAAAATASSQNVSLSVGQYIEHERFGLGEVLKVEGEEDSAKALIRFENAGEKQLLLRFARFKVV